MESDITDQQEWRTATHLALAPAIGNVRSQYRVCTSSKPAGKVNHRAPGNEFDSARTSRFVKARASGSPPRILPCMQRRGTQKDNDGVGLPRSEEEGSRHSVKRDRRDAELSAPLLLARYELSFGEASSRGAWGRLKQIEGERGLEEHPARVPDYDLKAQELEKESGSAKAVHLFTRV
jgi:hypothetical protein